MRDAVITRPQTIVELIAPGPAINGSANGTTPMLSRMAVSDFSCLFVYLPQLPADHRHCNGDNGIPPAILNESIEIPNSCRMPSPRNKELHKIIATDRFAVRLVLLRAVAVW